MSKNSKHDDTTVSLGVEHRSLNGVIFHPTKPVLDSELNLGADLSSANLQDAIRSKVPSGWLDANFDIGFDENYETYGVNTTLESDTFYLNSLKDTPSLAVVNGWLLEIGGNNIEEDYLNKIVLNPAVNSREDLVFLEVWKAAVVANSTQGKPEATKLWKYGNVNYGGVNLADEIVNESVGFQTTTRVQIQYRIRVVNSVDFESHPEGISDVNNVYARGGSSTNSTLTFENAGLALDDYGLYIAGDGSDSAKTALKSVDGYVYAIPMFRIQRRNKTAFGVTNQNGSEFSLEDNVSSDRPDGLFYDQVHNFDIEDLRHAVSFDNFNYKSLLEDTFDRVLSGRLDCTLQRSELDNNLKRTNIGFYVNKISSATGPGTNLITQPNSQQRYYSDVPATKLVTEKFDITDKTVGSTSNDWASSDQISLEVKSPSPSGTVIGTGAPIVRFKHVDSGVESVRTVTGTFSGSGTGIATFTLGDNSGVDLTNETIYVTYEIDYPQKGNKLTRPVTNVLRVHDVTNNREWGMLSVTDKDSLLSPTYPYRREIKVPVRETLGNTDYGFTYSIQSGRNYYGIGTLVSYFMAGNGTQEYTIPGTLINPQDTEYVLAAYDVDSLSPTFMNIVSVSRNASNFSTTVTLPYSIDSTRAIRFDVVVNGGVLEFDERTQTVEDLGKVDWYEIQGNGTNKIVLKDCLFSKDPDEIILGAQTEYYNGSYQTACYIDNFRQFVDVVIDPDTSFVTLNFSGAISTGSKIRIALLSKKTLVPGDNLNIYYDYKEYKGISAKTNFAATSDSYISSEVLFHENKLSVMTNGTGGINTADLLPKRHENAIPMLPLKDGLDGEFTGTIHTVKEILGGSYSLATEYSTPYTAGQRNGMNKEGVVQTRGTSVGGMFTSVAADGESGVHKLLVASLLEKVLEDGTGNFLPGEIALKIETNHLYNTSTNRITNSQSGETTNSYDMFKVKGRPLIKKNSR